MKFFYDSIAFSGLVVAHVCMSESFVWNNLLGTEEPIKFIHTYLVHTKSSYIYGLVLLCFLSVQHALWWSNRSNGRFSSVLILLRALRVRFVWPGRCLNLFFAWSTTNLSLNWASKESMGQCDRAVWRQKCGKVIAIEYGRMHVVVLHCF